MVWEQTVWTIYPVTSYDVRCDVAAVEETANQHPMAERLVGTYRRDVRLDSAAVEHL